MVLSNIVKLKAHFEAVINGSVTTGNSVRDRLIVSDAEENLKKLLIKFPNLAVKEVKAEVKEIKSKDKK